MFTSSVALNRLIYHVFRSLSEEKASYSWFLLLYRISQSIYIFYSLIEVKSLDMSSTYINLFATMIRFRNKKIRAPRSLEVAGHQQYLVRSENSSCQLFIIGQYHRVDVYSESARVTDKVRPLITLCSWLLSSPSLRLPSPLHSVSGQMCKSWSFQEIVLRKIKRDGETIKLRNTN